MKLVFAKGRALSPGKQGGLCSQHVQGRDLRAGGELSWLGGTPLLLKVVPLCSCVLCVLRDPGVLAVADPVLQLAVGGSHGWTGAHCSGHPLQPPCETGA